MFTALRRLHSEIYYFKTKTGREVDFILPTRGQPKMLVQVFESLAELQKKILAELKKQGKIRLVGRGRGARWEIIP